MSATTSKILTRSAALAVATATLAGTAMLAASPASAASAATSAASARPNVREPGPPVIWYGDCGEFFIVNSNNVRIRTSPGTSAPIEAYAEKGQWFTADYRTVYTYNGYDWAYGIDLQTDTVGYIAMSLLNDQGGAGCTYLQ